MAIQKISSYSADGGGDWKAALQTIWTAIKTQGGVIDADTVQEFALKSAVTMSGLNPNLKIRGDGSTRVKLMTSEAAVAWQFGDISTLQLEDLMFTGEGTEGSGAPTDAQDVVLISSVLKAILNRCHFVGIKGGKLLTFGNQVDFVINDSILSGNSCAAAIYINGAYRGEVNRCHFLDYAYISPNSYSKTPDGAGAWIKAENPPPSTVGANQHHLKFTDLILDEGAPTGVDIDGYDDVFFERCKVNIQGTGFKINNVKRAEFRACGVGYNNVNHAMIRAIDVDSLTIIGQKLDDNELAHPFRIEVDADTKTGLKLLQSPNVIVTDLDGNVYP